ncbi:unnamed protein product [Heterotrigona itama]|uniref:Exonuclease domain-containing protein n=1 Tax=Heterotrigona itama TaxID=395501 RepID=A0A6V7H8I7_9HYME|nr:unnamed protein product [Heterotrigona itama]
MLQPGKQYECKRNQALAKATPSGSKSCTISSPTTMSVAAQSRSPSLSSQSTKEDRASLSRRQRKNRTKNPREQRREPHDEGQQRQHQQHDRRDHAAESNIWQLRMQSESYQVPSNLHYEHVNNVNVMASAVAASSSSLSSSSSSGGFLSELRKELWLLSDADLASILRSYTLTWEHLARLGYPMECSYYPGSVMIINHFPLKKHRQTTRQHYHLDANAREFVPGGGNSVATAESEADSGNSSGSSDLEQESCSDSDKSSDNGESTCSSDFACQSRRSSATELVNNIVERKCARCEKLYYVNLENGSYLSEEECTYHWGKLRNEGANYMQNRVWDCCRGEYGEPGCTTAKKHVWTGLTPGFNGPYNGYVRTKVSRIVPEDGNYGIYALDCEMCFTQRGLDLVKITVVDMGGNVVYDTLVKPYDQVIDYNTKFSGITADDLANVTKTLRDVQRDLTSFIHAETILVGHALENDLRALRMLHTTVVDTCVVYPHYLGYPFRSSLKTLARVLLRKDIQQTPQHDSVEDARTVVDLILKKVQYHITEDHSTGYYKNDIAW